MEEPSREELGRCKGLGSRRPRGRWSMVCFPSRPDTPRMSWALYNSNPGPDSENHRTYDGPDKDEKAVTEIVVKQAMISKPSGRSSSGLTHEALALGYFRESGSPHIVKMYRHLYEERGNNSMRMDRRWVHRLFLEYCPGGDLFGWFQHKLKS